MALNANTSTALITNFKGSTPAVDPEDVDPSHGLYCQNCDFLLGQTESVQVSMRRGTGQVAQFPTFTGGVPSMDSWYFASVPPAPRTAIYQGGPLVTSGNVRLVYWGAYWGGTPAITPSQIDTAFDSINGSGYFNKLTQYGIPSVTRGTSIIVTSTSPSPTFTDTDVVNMLSGLVASATIPAPTGIVFYQVIMPPMLTLTSAGRHFFGANTGGGGGNFWCGWSTWNSLLDDLTKVTMHEVVEGLTDPQGTGWQVVPVDPVNWNEISDVCVADGISGGHAVQAYYSSSDAQCVIPPAPATPPGQENCLAVYYSTTQGVLAWDQLHQTFTGLLMFQTNAIAAVFAFDGARLYAAFQNSSGRGGFAQGQVYGQGIGADPLFAAPLISATDVNVLPVAVPGGVVTAGGHAFGFIFTTRNGYVSPLNPVLVLGAPVKNVFAPASIGGVLVNEQIRLDVTFLNTPPSYLQPGTIQAVMTSATNFNRYYLVPNATADVPGGPATVSIVINIADNDLVEGTDVTQNQNFIASIGGIGAHPPFLPSAIFPYSSRLGYVTIDSAGFPVIYFSEKDAYQALGAFSAIYLEQRQIPVMGASLGGTCYIATLSGLYSVQDNGDLPATWTSPAHVDGSVGALAPGCMITSGGKILIASEKGLYLFRGGAFPQIPISYWQSTDWNRINWTTPWQVQLVDDSYDKVLRVLAPLRTLVSGASNTNPIVITTAIPHLIADKAAVTIAGVFGNTAANGAQFITRIDDYNFSIPAAGNGAYTFGGTITPFNANAVMTWAYPEGDAPGEVFYSIQGFLAYTAGTMATVRNINTGVDEVWFSRAVPTGGNSGFMTRRFLPTDAFTLTTQGLYQDVTWNGAQSAIPAIYETSLLPGSQDEAMTIRDHHGAHFRVTGEGALNIQVATLDHATVITPIPSQIILSPKPGMEILRKWFLRNEDISIIFSMTGLFQYFNLALVRSYYTNSLPQR